MTESTGKAPDAAADALAATMLSEVSAELSHADDKASLLIGSLGIAFTIVLSALLGGDGSARRSWSSSELRPRAE